MILARFALILSKVIEFCGNFVSLHARMSYSKTTTTMAKLTTVPEQGQILVNIEDMSMLKDIKRAIGLMRGVGKITVPRRKRISSYERSLRDLDEGRIYEAKDVDDLFNQCLG